MAKLPQAQVLITATLVVIASFLALFTEDASAYKPLKASGSMTASCERAALGPGLRDWRRRSTSVGRRFGLLGPFRDFGRLNRYRNNLLRAKIPAVVQGHEPVLLRIPVRQRRRVALGYSGGRPNGRYAQVEFRPCEHKPRTWWPGGLLLRDRQPITLTVQIGGREAVPIRIGGSRRRG